MILLLNSLNCYFLDKVDCTRKCRRKRHAEKEFVDGALIRLMTSVKIDIMSKLFMLKGL